MNRKSSDSGRYKDEEGGMDMEERGRKRTTKTTDMSSNNNIGLRAKERVPKHAHSFQETMVDGVLENLILQKKRLP